MDGWMDGVHLQVHLLGRGCVASTDGPAPCRGDQVGQGASRKSAQSPVSRSACALSWEEAADSAPGP